MTNQEAIDKMEFCKRAYQRLIDENSQEGVFVGKGFEGKWKADTPLYKAYEDMRDACDMSIKALEQNPSGDAISRQATIEAFQMFRGYEANRTNAEWVDRIETIVKKLPLVNPQEQNCKDCDYKEWLKDEIEPKTGHWLYIDERKAKCSQCGYIQITGGADKTGHCNIHYGVYKYCTNCGAKMVEPPESEVQDVDKCTYEETGCGSCKMQLNCPRSR